MDENNSKIIELLSDMRSDLKQLPNIVTEVKVINEKIKRFDTMDERVTVLEKSEAKNQGSIQAIRWVGGAVSAVLLIIASWLCSTTMKNNNDVALLLQRFGAIESILYANHK